MMTVAGIVLAGGLGFLASSEQIDYDKIVELVKVNAVVAKEAKHYDLAVTFNLPPDIPKGIKIFFELQRDGVPVTDPNGKAETFAFILATENRKGAKFTWTPKVRLTVNKYNFQTSIPVADQSPEVKKAIQGLAKRFPPTMDPWSYSHAYMEFKVGTDAEAEAEGEEVKEFIESKMDAIIELNNEAMDEMEKVKSGEAHVKSDKLTPDSLKKFLLDWTGRLAEVQKSIAEAIVTDPGLYTERFQPVHSELSDLGRMIAKRISRIELKRTLDKYKVPMGAIKLGTVSGFDPNYPHGTSAQQVKDRCASIARLLDPKAAQEDGEGAEEKAGEEGGKSAGNPEGESKEDPGGEAKSSDDGGKKDEAKAEEVETGAEQGKSAPKGDPKAKAKADKSKSGAMKADAKGVKSGGKKPAQ